MRAPGPDDDERRRRATRAPVPDDEEEEGAPLSSAPSAANGSMMAAPADRWCMAQIDDSRARSSEVRALLRARAFGFFLFFNLFSEVGIWPPPKIPIYIDKILKADCVPTSRNLFWPSAKILFAVVLHKASIHINF
jgi:hypothetical protein